MQRRAIATAVRYSTTHAATRPRNTMSYPQPTSERTQDLAENVKVIKDEMAQALKSRPAAHTRSQNNPTLVLVSKLKPPSDLMAAYNNLAEEERHFGENYVQELVDKAKELPTDIKWHFIGSLQSNKCKTLAAIPNLYAVETLDSIKKADLFEKALSSSGDSERKLNVYLQVNTSGEDAKSGLPPLNEDGESSQQSGESLTDVAQHILQKCPHLHLKGLMTIGALQSSFEAKPGQENPDFVRLRETRDRLEKAVDVQGIELSMGMSNDFAAAIESGSDNVRVGSRIFGQRPSKEEAKQQREKESTAS